MTWHQRLRLRFLYLFLRLGGLTPGRRREP